MILHKPEFYDKFKCIASQCTDTCCVGWEIDIDKASQEAYRKVAGIFGDKLRENIEDGHFKLLPHDHCPFLDKENLCEIYTNLGKDALCDICREHPRFVEVYGDIMERGIGLCCEEATRLLLAGDGPLTFTSDECDEPEDELSEDDAEIRDEVLWTRNHLFNILANESDSFGNRLYEVFGVTNENPFTPFESIHDMIEALAKTESYGPAWDRALSRIKSRLDQAAPSLDQGFFSENDSSRLLTYLLYRHYAKSLYDGREQGRLLFALFFWNIARFFTQELAGDFSTLDQTGRIKIDAIKILSKQLEYSEENMDFLTSILDGENGLG